MASVTDPSLIAMFDRQMVEFYLAARSRPWADVKVDDDVTWGTTGLPLSAFNGATAATFTEASVDARIDQVLDYFRELKIDMSWWVGPTSTPADLGQRLVARGLAADGVAPGMAVSLEGWTRPPLPDRLVVEPALDAATFRHAMEVMFAGFEMPADLLAAFEERFRDFCVGPRAIQRTFLGTADGRPVATSLGMVVDDVLGIYNVATVPDARRLGFGGAVTAAAMGYGRERGARWAILESSPMGVSVYERLGFRQVCEVVVYEGQFSGRDQESPRA
jgi:ribosomal protein S18 acetylase RimI-like enzyme